MARRGCGRGSEATIPAISAIPDFPPIPEFPAIPEFPNSRFPGIFWGGGPAVVTATAARGGAPPFVAPANGNGHGMSRGRAGRCAAR